MIYAAERCCEERGKGKRANPLPGRASQSTNLSAPFHTLEEEVKKEN